ncbi:MAG: bacteriohemerythrin [Treponema sp.]|nr:bacteriohemerythrin [Treponema sp.]
MIKEKHVLVKWSATFSVGIKIIDDQHKGLINLVNDLFNHVTGNREEEYLYFKKIIQSAVQYVKVHFKTEEEIMSQANFPGYSEHKKEHDKFIMNILDMVNNYEKGIKLTLSEFTKFLREWILTHIAIMDKQYFVYFKQVNARNVNGELIINI